MRRLIVIALLLGAFAGYLYFFADRAAAPEPPPPPPPLELAVGSLALTLEDWRAATSTEAARIDVTLEDPGPRRAEVIGFVERTLAGYAEQIDPAAVPPDELAWIRESGRPYALSLDGKFASASGGRSSYRLAAYLDTGGAHPNGVTTAESYGPDGRRLALEDVIGPDRALERLAAATRPRLLAEIRARADQGGGDAYEPGEDFEAGAAPSPENYANWYLAGDDLVVIVNPYQVGPYALGRFEIAVPLAEIGR